MCLSEFAQTADGAFFLELRASEEYAAVGSNTSVFTLRVSPALVSAAARLSSSSHQIALLCCAAEGQAVTALDELPWQQTQQDEFIMWLAAADR
jgi:hypothetical protein